MDLIESYRDIDEENRLQSTLARRVEYLTTVDILNTYCFDKSSCIDVGCGVGIYSLYLDQLGVKTTAIDLVPDHIDRLNSIIAQKHAGIQAHVGNALDLAAFSSSEYDVVLCLGPLYHLLTPIEQDQCIEECKRVSKTDGILLFSYISPYSVLPCAIRGDIHRLSPVLVEKIVDEHKIESDSPYCFWTDTYFHDPSEIEELLMHHDLEIIDHIATDGQSIAFQNVINQMTEEEFEVWMKYHLKICRKRSILGTSNHGLVVTRKRV